MRKYTLLLILLAGLGACIPPKNEVITEVKIDLKDPVYRHILDLQDQQLNDSLFIYLKNNDPSYRYAAAMAFASIRDEETMDSLTPLMDDPIPMVRVAASFALGQIANGKAVEKLISAFNSIDTIPANNQVNASILESVGRCGTEKHLQFITSVTSYRPTDTLLLYGQAKAIYNFSLRDLVVQEGTDKMVEFLTSTIYPENVRLIAAAYCKRTKNLNLKEHQFRLNKSFQTESNPFIKMDLAIALGKTADMDVLPTLLTALADKNDYRVKVNILRALGNFTYIDVVESVIEQLTNPNIHIAVAASEFLVNHGQPNDVIIYRRLTKQELPWQVKSKIFEAIIKHVPHYFSKTKGASIYDIKKIIESSSNSYEKAAYIKILGFDYQSLELIRSLGFDANELPARTAAVEALNTLLANEELEGKMNRFQFTRYKKNLADLLKQAFESGDMGTIALAAIGFNNSSFDIKSEYEDLDFIQNAKNNLSLPQDVETYNEILKLESELKNIKYEPVVLEHNHPINWTIFDKLSEQSKAIIETNKGDFEISFLANNAPGSVINFIELTEKGYFEGKRFHRVVPNFVIQTGCSRGDGWGSLEYSIRSELSPLNYDDEAFVGMASAGNHTESSQWFVTHSPTLHLDGNYTIFGKIIKGMDTVHDISVGDIMQSVKIIY